MTDPQALPRTPCRHKPARAEIARANGARSRGPTSEAGRRRSSLNALVHGLRARRHLAVAMLGEGAPERDAHFAAVREELGGTAGPIARHLAETAAASLWRGVRAERLEGELLAGLGAGGEGIAKALHADRDARATLALFLRYRREADGELRRSLDALTRLRRAQAEGLLPNGEAAEEADAALAAASASLPEPNEPRIEKIGLPQAVAPVEPASPPSGPELLAGYRLYRGLNPAGGRSFWERRSPAERAAMRAAAIAEGASDVPPEDAAAPVPSGFPGTFAQDNAKPELDL